MPTVRVETEGCHAPRLSSGRDLSPVAGLIGPLKLPGCLVIYGGGRRRFVIGVDPRREGTGDGAGTHPLGPPPEARSGYCCGCRAGSHSSGRYTFDTHHTCLDQGRDLSVGEANLVEDLVGVGAGF
jgi:hypothetical protein